MARGRVGAGVYNLWPWAHRGRRDAAPPWSCLPCTDEGPTPHIRYNNPTRRRMSPFAEPQDFFLSSPASDFPSLDTPMMKVIETIKCCNTRNHDTQIESQSHRATSLMSLSVAMLCLVGCGLTQAFSAVTLSRARSASLVRASSPVLRVDPSFDSSDRVPLTKAELNDPNIQSSSMRPAVVDLAAAKASQPTADTPSAPATPAMPIIDQIYVGGKQLAGDYGFDPLALAGDSKGLAWYREAEMKHARLAMLAAVGWPVAELVNSNLADTFGLPSLLVDGRVPSILNGGLGEVNLAYWLTVLGFAIYVESTYLDKQLSVVKDVNYLPGMLGIDVFGADSPALREAEILNGRVAMVAVVIFALEEALGKSPITAETPIFFQPIWSSFGL